MNKDEQRMRALEKLKLLADIYPEFEFVMFDKDMKIIELFRGYKGRIG